MAFKLYNKIPVLIVEHINTRIRFEDGKEQVVLTSELVDSGFVKGDFKPGAFESK